MSSRYPNSNNNRERSPPPRFDRRPSGTYSSLGSSYRGAADSGPPSDRAPPRGPKADFRGSGFAARGRGGFPRSGDTWDRDRDRDRDREARPAPQSYRARDDDRPDWQRRDRDFGTVDRGGAVVRDSRPYVASRDRSASPIRARRDSRESIPSTYSRPADNTSYYAPASRGGLTRGRGRGDWERSRGRNSFVGERDRDLFHNRSRSRESWRDRDFDRGRQIPPESDRPDRYDRRDFDRGSRERDTRGQDIRQRDHSPARSTGGHALGPVNTPSTLAGDRPIKPEHESSRKASVVATPSATNRDLRRDGDQSDYFGASRTEPLRRDPVQTAQQPASAVGLDYGPPPSIAPVTTPASEKPPASKPPVPKIEPVVAISSSFQPPSGPKAVRTPSTPNAPQGPKASQSVDAWPRSEPHSRPLRTSIVSTSSNTSADTSSKKDEPSTESRTAQSPALDRSMPPNVPSGPRLGSTTSNFKPRIASVEPVSATTSPTAFREQSKPTAPDSKAPTIPTGPRLDRELTHRDGPRQSLPGTSSKSWVAPEYKPKPSIMNQLNKPYQPEPRERAVFIPTGPRQASSFHGLADKARPLPSSITSMPTAPTGPKSLSATSPRIPEGKITLIPRQPIEEVSTPDDVEMSMPATSEDEDEGDDDAFDEEYYLVSEDRFKQEMALLEARKPPPLLQDGTIVSLLIKLQFLEMLLQDSIPQTVPAPTQDSRHDVLGTSNVPTNLPSPAQTSNETSTKSEPEEAYPKGRPLKQAPVNPIPTPPIEDLPYLDKICPHRVLFDESDNEVEHEAVNILLQQEFEDNAWDWRSEMGDTEVDFKRKYHLWRQEIALLEHDRRELQASPAPASPAPSVAPSVTPSLTHERTRGARNTTEADLQAAILMSQQSAKEEEERREREAASSSIPNYETEAVIPSMLRPAEIESCYFEDTNRLIANELIIDIYAYLPPVDDFTDEEQALFITAYCQTPKKWGKIAESIPGRSYQECIAHYYLTKNREHYKDIWRRSQPKKRRGRAATKPRSTALMSELVYGDDGEAGPVAVTDSGRPRRAAAPTFGDPASENDPSTPVPQSKKLATALKDGSAEPTPKATRGRKAGIATKTRRTKAQIQADQQALLNASESLPAKSVNGTKMDRGRTLLRAENIPIRADPPPVSQPPQPIDTGPPQYPIADGSVDPIAAHNPVTSQVTSYWSVPEQSKFPQLLAYFGRDFAAIAEFMKTKSMTMIKNYYVRQVNDGKEEFEKFAQIGEQARAAGKKPGQPPSPIAPPKRRYEATPSMAVPRHVPVQIDQLPTEVEPLAPMVKQNVIDEFPRNIVERNALGNVIAKPQSNPRDVPPLPLQAQPKVEEVPKLDRTPLYGAKPLHGPRPGVFQEDHLGFPPNRQPLRMPPQDQSPHQHSQRLAELTRTDHSLQPPLLAISQTLLNQSRDSVQQVQQRSQPPPVQNVQSVRPPGDKYAQPPGNIFRHSHNRTNSTTAPSHSLLEQAQDLTSLRLAENKPRTTSYSLVPNSSQNQASTPSIAPAIKNEMPVQTIPPSTTPVPPPVDPPKPPTKRSNVFGLLNDDPPDPPPKRPSLEASKRPSLLSPQPGPEVAGHSHLQHQHRQGQQEDSSLGRLGRGAYNPGGNAIGSGSGHSLADYQNALNNAQAAPPSNETWIDRFDPRPQSGLGEPRNPHHSPGPSHYSVIPPSTQSNSVPPLHSLRADTPRGLERSPMDHRRSLLSNIGQMPHAPSPPPQQTAPTNQPYRSMSGSSHHSRVSSIGYAQGQSAGQAGPLGLQPTTLPQSGGSTPVSSLHQRGPSSHDFQPRLTIQQHMAQKQQELQREHDRQVQRQREVEVAQQRDRDRERERERDLHQHHHHHQQQQQQPPPPPPPPQQQQQQQHLRRDIFGIDPHTSGGLGRQTQLGGVGNQSHMSFAQREIPRTFTPPQQQQHHHSPYGGPNSVTHTLNHPHQHQQSGPLSQNQGPPSQQSQPPPPQHQMHHRLHAPQPQRQPPPQSHPILHPGTPVHYRGLSQGGEPRREERR